jgi:hypothetical protein
MQTRLLAPHLRSQNEAMTRDSLQSHEETRGKKESPRRQPNCKIKVKKEATRPA